MGFARKSCRLFVDLTAKKAYKPLKYYKAQLADGCPVSD